MRKQIKLKEFQLILFATTYKQSEPIYEGMCLRMTAIKGRMLFASGVRCQVSDMAWRVTRSPCAPQIRPDQLPFLDNQFLKIVTLIEKIILGIGFQNVRNIARERAGPLT